MILSEEISLSSWQALCCENTSTNRFLEKPVGRFCLTVPVSDAGSLAIEPSLFMVLMTKFFSRVKFVSPTLSELSMINTMSRAPQSFSQSAKRQEQKESQSFMGLILLRIRTQTEYSTAAYHSNHMFP